MPDLTIAITIDVRIGLERARRRNAQAVHGEPETRIDQQSIAFHEAVAEGYERLPRPNPQRFRLVDGMENRK